jgi:hypothetical protein
MNLNEAMREIINQCEEVDGFLLKLRINTIFDVEQYQSLINALSVYEQGIEGDTFINRRIAGCIFYLVQILDSMSNFYAQKALADEEKVKQAHAQVWGLAERLFRFP